MRWATLKSYYEQLRMRNRRGVWSNVITLKHAAAETAATVVGHWSYCAEGNSFHAVKIWTPKTASQRR